MKSVFVLSIVEEDCDGENTYIDGVFEDRDKAFNRGEEKKTKDENITSYYIEEYVLQ